MALSTALKNALDMALHGTGTAEEFSTAVDTMTTTLGAVTAAEAAVLHGAVAGTPTASKAFVADANGDIGALKATSIALGASGSETTVTSTAAELNILHGVTDTTAELNVLHSVIAGTARASSALVIGATKQVDTIAVASLVSGTNTAAGSQAQATTIINRKVAIVDAAATSVFRVTCPNGENAAVVEVALLATAVKTAGATFESSRCAVGLVVFDRTTGAALVGTATALTNTGIATSGTDTLTLAYSVAAVSGAVGATNTIDIQVTLTGSGTDTHQLTALATIINSEASGMTIAAL